MAAQDSTAGGHRAAYLLAVATFALIFLLQTCQSEVPDHGDSWTDKAHVISARVFDRLGFGTVKGLQALDYSPAVGLPPLVLVHHPSFPVVVLGVGYRLGLSTVAVRAVPLAAACSALLAIYFLVFVLTRSRLAGLLTMLFVAVAPPFVILADSLAYMSYDLAAKAWTWLFLALAVCGRRPLLWTAAAGVGAFLAITLSGFETVPAIFLFGLLVPLMFSESSWPQRLRKAAILGTAMGTAFCLGMFVRLLHNSLQEGSLIAAINDYRGAFQFRSFSDPAVFGFTRPLGLVLIERCWHYFPTFLVLGAVALLAVICCLGSRRKWEYPALVRLLGLTLACNVLWFLVFRQHTQIHAHTVVHLVFSAGLLAAVSALALLEWTRNRAFLHLAAYGLILFTVIGSGFRFGVKSCPNCYGAWNRRAIPNATLESLKADAPLDAIVVIDLPDFDPNLSYFLDRTFVIEPGTRGIPGWFSDSFEGHQAGMHAIVPADSLTRPWYVVTRRERVEDVLQRWQGHLESVSDHGNLTLFRAVKVN